MKPANSVLRDQIANLKLKPAVQEEAVQAARRISLEIEAKIATLQNKLDAIAYPVETLPAELLSLIFRFMRYEDAYGLELPRCSPQPLLAVCRVWRQVALASSELWTHLAVDISSPWPAEYLSEDVEDWLARAGKRPLYVAIHGPSDAFDNNRLKPVFRRFSPQIRHLVLRNMTELDIVNMNRWPQLSFQILEYADVSVVQREDYDTLYADELLNDAPRLRTYHFANIDFAPDWIWSNLAHLTVQTPTWVQDCVNALSQLPLLVSLRVETVVDGTGPADTAHVHASLQELRLEADGEDEIEEFISTFTFPALRILDLGKTVLESTGVKSAVVAFLDRSHPPLRELVICARQFSFLEEFTGRFKLTELKLEMPSKPLVQQFFMAYYATYPQFCATLQSLSFVLRDTMPCDQQDAKIRDFLRVADESIHRRRLVSGASFQLRSFRVTRIQKKIVPASPQLDSAKLKVFRELKAGGMDVLFDVDENGHGSLV